VNSKSRLVEELVLPLNPDRPTNPGDFSKSIVTGCQIVNVQYISTVPGRLAHVFVCTVLVLYPRFQDGKMLLKCLRS